MKDNLLIKPDKTYDKVFLVAFSNEIEAILKNASLLLITKSGNELYEYENNLILITGIGLVNTANAVTFLFEGFNQKFHAIYNLGVTGSASKSCKINEIFFVYFSSYTMADLTNFGYKWGQLPNGQQLYKWSKTTTDLKQYNLNSKPIELALLLSCDSFISNKSQLKGLKHFTSFHNIILDMEGNAIAQVCKKYSFANFFGIKVVSDNIFELPTDKKEFDKRVKKASIILSKILKKLSK